MKMHITAGWRDAVFKKPIASDLLTEVHIG